MDKKKLTEIIEIFKESGLGKMELSETSADKTFSLKLEKNADMVAALPVPAAMPVPAPAKGEPSAEPSPDDIKDYNKYRVIRSPMVGIFYAAPSPDAEPFVKVGQKVKKGDTLCIIEAMKLMNEITAEEDGVISDICVTNGQVVEYGTELFRIKR